MPERLRCGVIGTGAMGLQHLNSFLHCARGTAVAVAETHPGRAKEAVDRYRVPRSYSNYEELLDQPDIDAVTIALPNHLHARVAVDALQARKHVLLEKPMALNAKEAAKIVETARQAKRTLMVGMSLRFHRDAHAAKALVERGDLGEVYHARGFWLRRRGIPRIGSWYTRKECAGGGCLADLGVDLLDLCLYLLGEFDVKAVNAQTYARFGTRGTGEMDWGRGEIDPKRPFDVEDGGVAWLRLKSGRTVMLETAWAANLAAAHRERGIDLWGTAAGISLFPARLCRSGAAGYETIELAPTNTTQPEDSIHHFVNTVLEGRRPLVAPDEALKVQRVLDAFYTSAESGREVRLE
jgi:predicted dehydrogenase